VSGREWAVCIGQVGAKRCGPEKLRRVNTLHYEDHSLLGKLCPPLDALGLAARSWLSRLQHEPFASIHPHLQTRLGSGVDVKWEGADWPLRAVGSALVSRCERGRRRPEAAVDQRERGCGCPEAALLTASGISNGTPGADTLPAYAASAICPSVSFPARRPPSAVRTAGNGLRLAQSAQLAPRSEAPPLSGCGSDLVAIVRGPHLRPWPIPLLRWADSDSRIGPRYCGLRVQALFWRTYAHADRQGVSTMQSWTLQALVFRHQTSSATLRRWCGGPTVADSAAPRTVVASPPPSQWRHSAPPPPNSPKRAVAALLAAL